MKLLRAICFVFFIMNSLNSQSFRNVHGNYTIDDIQKNIFFDIFLERNLYEEGEIIPVYFKIKHIGYESFRFFLDQDYRSSFLLEVLDERGENIEKDLVIENTKDFELYSIQKNKVVNLIGNPIKEILLHPNEEFTKVYYIKHLPKGTYRLIGYFFPVPFEPNYKKNLRLISNRQIQIFIEKEKSVFQYDDEIEIQKESIPSPEETIYLFLMAEFNKNWDYYLKYIDLKEFIHSYELFSNEYKLANPKEKQNILNKFKLFLINQNQDPILNFKIVKVEYFDKEKAKVYVEVKRGTPNYKVLYLYEYSLKLDRYWKVVSVLVSILSKK